MTRKQEAVRIVTRKTVKLNEVAKLMKSDVIVSYEDGNKSMINAQPFRSFRDAKHTDYKYAAYECQHSGDILTYGENLKKMDSIKCFVNPNKPHYGYTDSSADNSGWTYLL